MSRSPLSEVISGLGYAESPRWDGDRLWFVDFFSGRVYASDLTGVDGVVATVPGTPGGLGFLPDGTPLVVSQREFALYSIGPGGKLAKHADLSAHARGAANDMLVDRHGRAYVGHHGFDFFGGAAPQPASLLLVGTDGRVRVVAEDLVFPNGMALTPDGRTLIVAESFAHRLTAFDVAGDGSLSGRRTFAQLDGHTPDGICLDSTGAVIAASPMTAAFVRVREGGEVLQTIPTADGRWAVACAFVGRERDTLACLTAATTLEGMPRGESKAFVETVDLGVRGAGLP